MWDRLLLQLLAPGRESETWPLQGDTIHGELFMAVSEKGKTRRERNACLKRKLLVRVCMFKPSSVST